LPRTRYPEALQRRAVYAELNRQVLSVPGVRDATATSSLPFRPPPITSNPITVIGGSRSGKKVEAERRYVLPNFFEMLGIRLIAGEWLPQPSATGGCQILVSQAAVRTLWPNGAAVGARVDYWGEKCTVTGVVSDTKERSLAADPLPTFYRIDNGEPTGTALLVRTDRAPESLVPDIRKVIARVDPDIAMLDPARMDLIIDRSLATERYRTLPLALFALGTMLLATVGTYGLMTQIVTRNRRALGIRLALGASDAQVMAMVLRQTATIAGAGLTAGVVAGLAATRVFRTVLYGVAATDVGTYAAVVIGLALVMLAAGWIPARRATRLDPAAVLRVE